MRKQLVPDIVNLGKSEIRREVVLYHLGPSVADSMVDLVKIVRLVGGSAYFMSKLFIVAD